MIGIFCFVFYLCFDFGDRENSKIAVRNNVDDDVTFPRGRFELADPEMAAAPVAETKPADVCASDPNFAVIFAFCERFGDSCGITIPTFQELQEMLEKTDEGMLYRGRCTFARNAVTRPHTPPHYSDSFAKSTLLDGPHDACCQSSTNAQLLSTLSVSLILQTTSR